MPLNIVVIEDEPMIAAELLDLLAQAAEPVTVAAHLSSVQEGLAYFAVHPAPDLILSDIRLGDGLSFDIFLGALPSCPVVFCTAYDEYMLDAFKNNGIDYLLKPIDPEALNATLERFKRVFQPEVAAPDFHEQLRSLITGRTPGNDASLLVRKGEFIIPVRHAEVSMAFLKDGKTHIRTLKHAEYVVPETMEQLQAAFGASHFRVNRQHLIHRDAIEKVAHHFSRKLLVVPKFELPEQLLVSKVNARAFLDWLQD